MADQTERTAPHFRRIVTGHDASGKPVIWADGSATNHKFPSGKITSTLMWSTNESPTRILSNEDEHQTSRLPIAIQCSVDKSFYQTLALRDAFSFPVLLNFDLFIQLLPKHRT